jgi:transcriptional regulator of heat shock response
MLTERQEKLLDFLIREYITTAEPVSSMALKTISDLDISAATVRNDLQELAEAGYLTQPHTSAGRVPTQKAYRYFSDKILGEQPTDFEDFIVRQIKFAHMEMEREMKFMEELMQTLEDDNLFEILNILDTWHKKTMN